MSRKESFVIEYGVEDGYVDGGRPHHTTFYAIDIGDDTSGGDLRALFNEAVQDAFANDVTPYGKNFHEFKAWAEGVIASREKELP